MSEEGLEPVPQEQRFTESGRGFVEGQQLFGRYILRQLIGRGGMELVWLAHDEALGEEIALKFLPETVRHDATALEESKRETRRSRKLAHANIVKVYDFVSDANAATISMEFIDGDTLSGIRAKQESLCFSVPQIEPWVKQLLNALSYAHEGAKVVHRDLKPANIMVDKHGALKVTDFGIASSINENVTRVTMARGTSGTVCYMSPQQAMGEKPCVQDDIYALGATLFELLTGKPPFFRGDILSQVWETVPPTLAERRGEFELGSDDIPEAWEQTIAACLAKDAAQRPQSMAEIAYLLGMRAPVAIAKAVPSPRITTQAPSHDSFVVKEAKPFLTTPVLGAIIAGVLVVAGLGYYFGMVAPSQKGPPVATVSQAENPTATAMPSPAPAKPVATDEPAKKASSAPSQTSDVDAALQTKPPTPDDVPDSTTGTNGGGELADLRTRGEAGDAKAAYELGDAYDRGLYGLSKDPAKSFEWYLKGAEAGNAKAQHMVGYAYEHAVGVALDYGKALEWFKKSAEQGYAGSQINVGLLYAEGKGTARDYGQAMKYYKMAAEDQGTEGAGAENEIGKMYEVGHGVPQDYEQAFRWYKKSAANPAAEGGAFFSLGHLYLNGWGVTKDDKQAFAWFQKSAAAGNPDGESFLGTMYLNGWGVAKDYAQALNWSQKSSQTEGAQYNLAVIYDNGWGVPRDTAKAIEYYEKMESQDNDMGRASQAALLRLRDGGKTGPETNAADVAAALQTKAPDTDPAAVETASDAAAARDQGLAFLHGDGVAKDPVAGRKLIEAAAEKGDSVAQDALGSLWQNGIGGQKDAATAFTWFKKAADQGMASSEFNVGLAFYNGTGVEKDFEQALNWFQKAATSDNREAQFNLGQMYENGEGTLRNADKAAEWYRKAAANGYQPAQEAMTRLGQ